MVVGTGAREGHFTERAVCQSCACMCDCLCEGMQVDSCLSAYVGQYILVCIYIDTYALYICRCVTAHCIYYVL